MTTLELIAKTPIENITVARILEAFKRLKHSVDASISASICM
jgi:hypothetical protein